MDSTTQTRSKTAFELVLKDAERLRDITGCAVAGMYGLSSAATTTTNYLAALYKDMPDTVRESFAQQIRFTVGELKTAIELLEKLTPPRASVVTISRADFDCAN